MSDLIDRQKAIDALGDEGLITAMSVIARVPNAQPERLAHWIYVEHETPSEWSYRCSNCSRLSCYPSEYCPFCGFNMNEEWRE